LLTDSNTSPTLSFDSVLDLANLLLPLESNLLAETESSNKEKIVTEELAAILPLANSFLLVPFAELSLDLAMLPKSVREITRLAQGINSSIPIPPAENSLDSVTFNSRRLAPEMDPLATDPLFSPWFP